MIRRSTKLALAGAVLVVSGMVVWQTFRLHRQASLSDEIQIDWTSWVVAVVMFYLALGLIGRWAVARDRS